MMPRIPIADAAEITSNPMLTSATCTRPLKGMTQKAVNAVAVETTGPNQNRARSASKGIVSSLVNSFSASAKGCNRPCGPTRIGP